MAKDSGRKVLVVEDDIDLCDIVAAELASEGYDVAQEFSGNRALAWLGQHAADIVVTDIKMPDGTGIDLLKSLTAMGSRAPLVILMTGYSGEGEAELIAQGARAVVRKPVDVAKLSVLIEQLLQSK